MPENGGEGGGGGGGGRGPRESEISEWGYNKFKSGGLKIGINFIKLAVELVLLLLHASSIKIKKQNLCQHEHRPRPSTHDAALAVLHVMGNKKHSKQTSSDSHYYDELFRSWVASSETREKEALSHTQKGMKPSPPPLSLLS